MVFFTVAQLKTFVAGIAAVHDSRLIGFPEDQLPIVTNRTVDSRGNQFYTVRAYFDPVTRAITLVP